MNKIVNLGVLVGVIIGSVAYATYQIIQEKKYEKELQEARIILKVVENENWVLTGSFLFFRAKIAPYIME